MRKGRGGSGENPGACAVQQAGSTRANAGVAVETNVNERERAYIVIRVCVRR